MISLKLAPDVIELNGRLVVLQYEVFLHARGDVRDTIYRRFLFRSNHISQSEFRANAPKWVSLLYGSGV